MLYDDFMNVISAVAEVAEISGSDMLSDSRKADTVEARCVAVKILAELGYSPARIARYFHKTETSIRIILTNFSDRQETNKILVKILQETRIKLKNKGL